ncbi:21482_t:CDS:1, partial [Dentiscutata erythropus]
HPNNVVLSAPIHFATCISKEILNCAPIPISYNGSLIHNPVNIDTSLVCFHLITQYCGIFDLSYMQRKSQWSISQEVNVNFNQIELLTIHSYDDAIKEKEKERNMEEVRLVEFKESNLHTLEDYLNALEMIISVNKNIG